MMRSRRNRPENGDPSSKKRFLPSRLLSHPVDVDQERTISEFITIGSTLILFALVLILASERLPPIVITDESLETELDGSRYQMVFSTDCSEFHNWQSYLLLFSAFKMKQRGHVTRIVSGCKSEEETANVRSWYQSFAVPLSNRFKIHFTPDFSQEEGNESYLYYNKPFGVHHWLLDESADVREDDIVILIDPDMILMRPITKDFSDSRENIITNPMVEERSFVVSHGRPFAQLYGLGDKWTGFDLRKHVGPGSPALLTTKEEASAFFPTGPPYLATGRDMKSIVRRWTEIVKSVHSDFPDLLAEMYSYSIAAADLRLPHQMIDSLMVSNTEEDGVNGEGGEGWRFVDALPPQDVCGIAGNRDGIGPSPSVVHYCQDYCVGSIWYFHKRTLPEDFFTCDSPLLQQPPSDIATKFDFKWAPQERKEPLSARRVAREAFMVCSVTSILNEASMHYKKGHCEQWNEKTINLMEIAQKVTMD